MKRALTVLSNYAFSYILNLMKKKKRIPVILNTGIGTDIDDTWALAMLLRSPELSVKYILTTGGDTYYRAKILAKLLHISGNTDIDIAIGPLEPCSGKFQEPWIADYELSSYPGRIHEEGIKAVADYLKGIDRRITIINLCHAGSIDTVLSYDTNIASRCRFIGMYGSIYRGYEDNSEACVESNISGNIEAFKRILKAPWQEFLMAPLDTSSPVIIDGELYQQLYRSHDPLIHAVIENYRIWADLVPWEKTNNFKTNTSRLFDTVPVYLAYASDLINIRNMELAVTDDGKTIPAAGGHRVSVAIGWKDLDTFKEHIVKRLTNNSLIH
jgi:pyrimidine-specific ribonucleoside hydrolase